MLMRNAEGMEEGEGCGSLSKVSYFSAQRPVLWAVLLLCPVPICLIQAFNPMKGLRVSVPVCCVSFHLGDVSHAYQSHVTWSTERKTS